MDTPYIIIDTDKLKRNIQDMAEFASRQGLKLRPHIKAHKIPEIAKMQMDAGAVGITVAKLGEAEVMFESGIDDILVAFPLIGAAKMARALDLLDRGCKLTLLVDSIVGAKQINQLAYPGGVNIMVKIDSGLGRCGLTPGQDLNNLLQVIISADYLNFRGILTHAGHAYGCANYSEVEQIGVKEGELMTRLATEMGKVLDVGEVSIGSTPTAKIGGKIPGVTEIRPGNYVFYDATQVALGVVTPDRCSLRVRATVISRPSPNRAVIDAGAKVLALDKGAHGGGALAGHGLLENHAWTLERLSEEHGIIVGEGLPEIGSVVEIIPNHACPVVNLADYVYIDDGLMWKVAARGKVQ